MTFYVFSRILNLQIHAHIYRSFIRHHKMLGVRIAKRKIVNDPTQFEQVDETCEFGGAVLYSESLGITAFFENVVPSKYETQKLKQLQFGIENEKIRQFEHECLIRLFQWSFLPPGKALDFSVCDEAFGCYKTQYRKRYLLEICQNASFLSTPDTSPRTSYRSRRLFAKVTSHSFCRGSSPNRNRWHWVAVWFLAAGLKAASILS